MGGRADATDPVALGGLKVGGALETADDGGACGGDCGALVGTASTHVHAGAAVGGDCHTRGGRSHRAIVVEDRQEQRFQERAVRECALNGQQGRTGEVALTLGVAPNVAREAPRGQELCGLLGDDPLVFQPIDLLRVELEAFQGLENATGSGDDTEAARGGQAAPKQLKGAATMRGAILQGGVEHRELVHISQQ